MIHVAGTSDLDYLRLLPFVGKFLPPFEITFSHAYSASDFIAETGQATANNLEITYRAWFSSVNHLLSFSIRKLSFRIFSIIAF